MWKKDRPEWVLLWTKLFPSRLALYFSGTGYLSCLKLAWSCPRNYI